MIARVVQFLAGFLVFHKPQDRQALLDTMRTCLEHTSRSTDSLDAALSAKQIARVLKSTIRRLEKGRKISKASLALLFLPTGDLQETAIDNDWGDEFAELAHRYENAI